MMGNEQKRIKTTDTVFDIIEAIERQGRCGVTDIADEISLSPSTVHAHLVTLADRGYLVRDGDEYQLSLQFFSLGSSAQDVSDYTKLRRVAKPEIDELAETTEERAQIVVEEEGKGFYLYQARGTRAVMVDTKPGTSVSLHSSAVGKAILAHESDERVDEILAQRGLPQVTESTITDEERLSRRLAEIREQGYAFDRGERISGIWCVAAPVQTDSGDVLGAISVSLPKQRAEEEFYERELPELVTNAARVIALNMVYR